MMQLLVITCTCILLSGDGGEPTPPALLARYQDTSEPHSRMAGRCLALEQPVGCKGEQANNVWMQSHRKKKSFNQ